MTAENGAYERAYTYDYQGRMVFAGDAIAGTAATYAYDPLGRRLSKSVQVGTGTATSVRYAWDGWNLVQERDPSTNQLQASYVHGMGLDTPLQLERGTQTYYYHTDEQGTVWALTDASGQVVERYSYGDYGQPTIYDGTGQVITTSAVGNSLMFTGREWDAESGLYHYRMRYMDPRAGRFTTSDPLGIWGDSINLGNPYAYCGNAPLMFVDPMGLRAYDKDDPLAPVNRHDYRTAVMGGRTPRWGDDAILAHKQEPFGRQVREWVETAAAFYDGLALGVDWSDAYDPCDKSNRIAEWAGQEITTAILTAGLGPLFQGMGAALRLSLGSAGRLGIGHLDDLAQLSRTNRLHPTGAFNPAYSGSGQGSGKVADKSIRVTQKGLDIIEKHLVQFGEAPQNTMMLDRLRTALSSGQRISGADAVYYLHEIAEATAMRGGASYNAAHAAALERYNVSPYSVYHPDVVSRLSQVFNHNWRNFWGL